MGRKKGLHNKVYAAKAIGAHILFTGMEGSPGGPSCISWRSTLLPCQRPERVTPAKESREINFHKVWWRRVRGTIPQVPEGTAHYKCAPLPIRANPPLSKNRCASKASGRTLVDPAGIEPATSPLRVGRSFHLSYGSTWLQQDHRPMHRSASQHLFLS